MMVNIRKLKAKMVERGKTVKELSAILNLNVGTVYRRFCKPEQFTVCEVYKITEWLHLTSDEVTSIFFASKVAFCDCWSEPDEIPI